MTEPRPPKHGVRNALVLGAIAVFVVRLGLHAFSRLLDLVWIVVAIAAVVAVVGARRRAADLNAPDRRSGTMWQSLKRWWHYLGMKLRVAQEEHADPKVQLEQAIEEARARHRRLSDTAAIVIAHQKQAQDRLDAKLREYEKAKASTGQAVLLIDREARHGNETQVATYTAAAEGLANRVLTLEREVRELDDALLQASAAAEDAKAAVVRNAKELEQQLDDRERLLSVLDRAKMQEALNQAHEQLSTLPGADVPTYAQVERKILGRQAVAEAKGELNAAQFGAGADPAMLEIEAAQRSAEAQAFLAQMRTQLGLGAPDDGTGTPPRMIER